jgi:hypothetical protein
VVAGAIDPFHHREFAVAKTEGRRRALSPSNPRGSGAPTLKKSRPENFVDSLARTDDARSMKGEDR